LRKDNSAIDIPQRYYLILSSYYEDQPEKIDELLSGAGAQLSGNIHYQIIFACLAHRWVSVSDWRDVLTVRSCFCRLMTRLTR
jgi:hypothetical protein